MGKVKLIVHERFTGAQKAAVKLSIGVSTGRFALGAIGTSYARWKMGY